LGDVATDKDNVSRSLTNYFEARSLAIPLLNTLTTREITTTIQVETIFRGNSVATKSVDYYMKLVGLPYLHKTIGHLIKEIFELKKTYEVDPTKYDAHTSFDSIEKNVHSISEWAKKFINAIFKSLPECPMEFRQIFGNIQKACMNKFGSDHISRYTAVSGFIFLRFFGPAILGPKLFEISKDHPSQITARTLTLIAKIIQNLGNLVNFGAKEEYMKDFNPLIQENSANMQAWLDELCTVPKSPLNHRLPVDIDTYKELALVHSHLVKDKEKALAYRKEKYVVDTTLDRLPGVLDELSKLAAKYKPK